MQEMKKILFILVLFCTIHVSAQDKVNVKGKITDTHGHGIEYVTISVDSLVIMSDAEGNFEMSIPKGHTAPMVFHHISYRPQQIPFETYKSGKLDVQMEEDVYELSNIIISNKKLKEKAISHKGVKMPGVCSFNGNGASKYEIGPVIDNKKDYLVKSLHFSVKECTYTSCTIRIILYEIDGKQFTPVQHKPIYMTFTASEQPSEHTVEVNEEIVLKRKHTYYIGVTIVDTNGKGDISFPAYLRSGYVRNMTTNRMKKLPATFGISMKGLVW